MPFNSGTNQFGAMKSGSGQSLMGPRQAVQLALAIKKKDSLDDGDYQAPNLMNALKKKKKGGQ